MLFFWIKIKKIKSIFYLLYWYVIKDELFIIICHYFYVIFYVISM